MKRHSGTEYRTEHHLFSYHLTAGGIKRCGHLHRIIFHSPAYLISHYLTNAFQIAAEAHHIILDIDIAELSHILADERRCQSKIMNLHGYFDFLIPTKIRNYSLSRNIGKIPDFISRKVTRISGISIIFVSRIHVSGIRHLFFIEFNTNTNII